jgi:hypothetical protein
VSAPRYRTLDGDELELPLAMDQWVLVPRGLARFDPELAWTLDYDDAPGPVDADPRLDFTEGALLVPVERWNEHAALEPNLAPCSSATPRAGTVDASNRAPHPILAGVGGAARSPVAGRAARMLSRAATVAVAALAVAYVVAVAVWLWSLRHQISGPDVSTGLLLIGAAMGLAWLAGVAGAVPGMRSLTSPRWRDWNGRTARLGHHLAGHPLLILRLGLVIQVAGFFALVAIH